MESLSPLGAAAQSPLSSLTPLEEIGGRDHRTAVENRLRTLASRLPDYLEQWTGHKCPFSGVIAFQTERGPVIKHTHSPNQATLSEDQPFNALSVGKLFTATAIMQLLEEGKFLPKNPDAPVGKPVTPEEIESQLNTPLNKLLSSEEMKLLLTDEYENQGVRSEYLEALRQNSSKITLRHLLTHTSGLYNPQDAHLEASLQADDTHERYNSKEMGKYHYSNYGFRLLAIIIGKHSTQGDPKNPLKGFEGHVRERIFEPANMEGAISELDKTKEEKRKEGPDRFRIDEGISLPEKVVGDDMTYEHGNGCFHMKADDLLAFERALQHNSLFRFPHTFQKMLTPGHDLDDSALGFMLQHPGGPKGYGHSGGGDGMTSFLWTWTETNPPLTFAMLSNYENRHEVHRILEENLSKIFK